MFFKMSLFPHAAGNGLIVVCILAVLDFRRKVFPHGIFCGEEIAHTFHSVLCIGCLCCSKGLDLWKDRDPSFFAWADEMEHILFYL